jgi:hypothetical protein
MKIGDKEQLMNEEDMIRKGNKKFWRGIRTQG